MLPSSLRIMGRDVSLDPRDPVFVQDPYAAYEAIRAVAPVFRWAQYGCWCVLGHEAVSGLLKDRRFGRQILHVTTREALGWPEPEPHLDPWSRIEDLTLLALEPPDHTRIRTLVNRAFVSRQVERLRPRIAALAHGLIDGFEARGEVELLEAFATPIPVAIIAELLGVPPDRSSDLLAWSHAMVAMYQFGRSRAVEDEAVRATLDFASFLRGYVAERRGAPADDLISTLIAAESAGDRLSEDELIATCIQLLNAGHEATVHAIGNGVKAILEAGLDLPALIAVEGAPGLVEEVMRFDAPLHLFKRYALEECEVAGIRLRQGEEIGLLLGAANRDPARFPHAEHFDPSRAPNPHVSLGAGIHFCIGAPLARLELEVALAVLFERLPRLRLAGRPLYRDSYHFHGLERLHVAW